MKRSRFTSLVLVALGAAVVGAADSEEPATQPALRPSATKIYRLQRIVIPASSKHRDAKYDEDSPPDLRIELMRNGNRVGDISGNQEGFEVEFSETNDDNKFEIDGSGNATFAIRVYDFDLFDPDDLMLTVSKLTAADFERPIYENLSENDPPSRRVQITFVPVE